MTEPDRNIARKLHSDLLSWGNVGKKFPHIHLIGYVTLRKMPNLSYKNPIFCDIGW